MNRKEYLCRGLIVAFLMGLVVGCASGNRYGKLRPAWSPETRVTIEQLYENRLQYDISYAGISIENPSAIIFDPKGDERKLSSDKWIRVKTQEELVDLIDWVQVNEVSYPVLWKILGPYNQLYGYMYSGWNHVLIKAVDDRTLWVDDLPLPPIDYGDTAKGSGGL